MSNFWSFWLALYLVSLDHAADNGHVLYFSRIDGALLPIFGRNSDDL